MVSSQVSVALNVWLPEIVRGRHKQIVEQSVMPAESRVHALEMELRLCKQQISGIRKSYEDEKMRLHKANEELRSLKYHPLQNSESILSSGNGECNTHFSAKRPKRSTKLPGEQCVQESVRVPAGASQPTPVKPSSSSRRWRRHRPSGWPGRRVPSGVPDRVQPFASSRPRRSAVVRQTASTSRCRLARRAPTRIHLASPWSLSSSASHLAILWFFFF